MSYKEDILKLRKQGDSYNSIAKKLGCSKGTVHFHCSKLEFNKDVIAKNLEKLCRPTPNLKKKELITYLVMMGNSKKIIADALNIDYDELLLFCKRLNISKGDILSGYSKIKQHRRNKKILAVTYLGGKCFKCDYNKSYSALEFHHREPHKKDFTIASNTNIAWNKLKKEIEKCDLLCANCHREEHDDWLSSD